MKRETMSSSLTSIIDVPNLVVWISWGKICMSFNFSLGEILSFLWSILGSKYTKLRPLKSGYGAVIITIFTLLTLRLLHNIF